jgi:hypothetical protein
MKKRFLVAVAYLGALGMVIVSGLGCTGLLYNGHSSVNRSRQQSRNSSL